jgi:hypothetical protein
MNLHRRYNWVRFAREDVGTDLVLLVVLVAIVFTFVR